MAGSRSRLNHRISLGDRVRRDNGYLRITAGCNQNHLRIRSPAITARLAPPKGGKGAADQAVNHCRDGTRQRRKGTGEPATAGEHHGQSRVLHAHLDADGALSLHALPRQPGNQPAEQEAATMQLQETHFKPRIQRSTRTDFGRSTEGVRTAFLEILNNYFNKILNLSPVCY